MNSVAKLSKLMYSIFEFVPSILTYLISIFRNTTAVEALWGYTTPKPINHNYTQCCIDESVPNECLGFCSIKNILEGTTGMNE